LLAALVMSSLAPAASQAGGTSAPSSPSATGGVGSNRGDFRTANFRRASAAILLETESDSSVAQISEAPSQSREKGWTARRKKRGVNERQSFSFWRALHPVNVAHALLPSDANKPTGAAPALLGSDPRRRIAALAHGHDPPGSAAR